MDDNATVRGAVRPLFDSHPNFEVCGEAEHGREAVEKAPGLRPDLIVLDLSMPVMNGLEAAPLLLKIPAQCVAHPVHGLRRTRSEPTVTCGWDTRSRSQE